MSGWRLRKRIKIAPGIRLNLSHRSAGITMGGKWARVSLNSLRGITKSVSIPGTGLYWTETNKPIRPTMGAIQNLRRRYSGLFLYAALAVLIGVGCWFLMTTVSDARSPTKHSSNMDTSLNDKLLGTPTGAPAVHVQRAAIASTKIAKPAPTATEIPPVRTFALITASVLNVREEPSTAGTVVDQVYHGDCVAVDDMVEGWAHLSLGYDVSGWSSLDYLDLISSCPEDIDKVEPTSSPTISRMMSKLGRVSAPSMSRRASCATRESSRPNGGGDAR